MVLAQNFSGFTNSSSRYVCNDCFLSTLLGLYDKFVFVCYRVLNTRLVTKKSCQDLHVSCQAVILLHDSRCSQVKLFTDPNTVPCLHLGFAGEREGGGSGGCYHSPVTPVQVKARRKGNADRIPCSTCNVSVFLVKTRAQPTGMFSVMLGFTKMHVKRSFQTP